MISIAVIFCLILQTSVALYLLQSSLADDDFERYLKMFLLILLVHLCTKYFLLAILHNSVLYSKLASGFSLFYGPYLLIIARLLLQRPMPLKVKLSHLLPFIVFSVLYLAMILGEAIGWIPDSFISSYEKYYQWIVLISIAGYPIYVKTLLHANRAQNRNASAKWQLISQICIVMLVMVGLVIAFEILALTILPKSMYFDFRPFAYACLVCVPVLILRYKLKKDSIAEPHLNVSTAKVPENNPMLAEIKSGKKYEKSGINNMQMDEYHKMLTVYMEKSKAYLNAELSLDELAHQTKIPKHHITQLLNDRLKKSFYIFINEYRIREAIRILENETKETNILSLAFDCGFNSKSSFNKYFKKITDQTPSSYRQMISANPETFS
jgi:AraC-like DNA-binding protein